MPRKSTKETTELSIQRRATKQQGGVYNLWFGRTDDKTGISEWWSPYRDLDLRNFWMKPGNDILQGAISSMTKWAATLPYSITGPKSTLSKWQELLSQAEFGQGWSTLISKSYIDYATQDKGFTWELIGEGSPDEALEGSVLGIAYLDSQFIQPTGDPVYPVFYLNPKDGKPHKIHATRVVRFVDMPSPNELMNGIGYCATSRVISSSQILLKLTQYKQEKLSDLPEAGLLVLNNVLPKHFEDAQARQERGRRKLGQEIWSNIMTLFSIDPAQPATANFINFSTIPEGFDELVSTNIYVNIVALAFGVDPREFWPMGSRETGSAKETEVMALKARGKGKGDIISLIERAVNWYILPDNVHFKFDIEDDEEDKRKAEINELKVKTIMSMWDNQTYQAGLEPPVSLSQIRQMLADNVPDYFKEDFLKLDITDTEEIGDTEKAWKIDNKGKFYAPKGKKIFTDNILALAEKNYREGKCTLDDLIEFRLGGLFDFKMQE